MVDLEPEYLDDVKYQYGQGDVKNVVVDAVGTKFGDFISGFGRDKVIKNSWSANADIDFSLSVYSQFDDLKSINEYYDVCDNYYTKESLTTEITLSVQDKNIEFNVNSLLNEGLLNSDNCLNKVSIGVNDISNFIFTYKITDPGENVFEISRNERI